MATEQAETTIRSTRYNISFEGNSTSRKRQPRKLRTTEEGIPIGSNYTTEGFLQDYERLKSELLKFAISRTSNKALAEDLCSDALVQMWLVIKDGRKITNVGSWLRTCVGNAAISHQRRLSTKREETLFINEPDSYDSPPIQYASNDSTPEEETIGKEEHGNIRTALSQIPSQQRDVVALRLEGYSFSEIGIRLQRNNATLRVQSIRGGEALKKRYGSVDNILNGTPHGQVILS